MTDRSGVRVVARIAVAGVLCHAAAFGLLHLLDPRIDPVRSSVLLVSVGVRRIPAWERTARILVLLAALAAVGLVLTLGLLLEAGFGGVGQRIVFVTLYAWALIASMRILKSGREDVSG